jgi:hypothetical protein
LLFGDDDAVNWAFSPCWTLSVDLDWWWIDCVTIMTDCWIY